MSLDHSKRGGIVTGLSTLGEIILILIAVGLFLGVFSYATSRVDEKTSENLCRGFNALRVGTTIETPFKDIKLVPRACKTIDKKDDVPSKQYKSKGTESEAVQAEIRDMMTRCWWMWLEGKKQNIFDSGVTLRGDKKCFICYTFSLDKSVPEINYGDFVRTLNDPYYAIDNTDRCAPAGNGGKCMSSCNTFSDEFSKEVASDKCSEDQKCCVAEDAQDVCKNKGGECKPEKPSEEFIVYPQWQCKLGTCYVRRESVASYLDYLQGTGGVDTGAGAVIFTDNENFHTQTKYAISFLSPGPNCNFDCFTALLRKSIESSAGTLAGIGLVEVTAALGGAAALVFAAPYIATGAVGFTLYEIYTTRKDVRRVSPISDVNFIMVSTYDNVKDVCDVQAGVGED